jgi:hypothetical protein
MERANKTLLFLPPAHSAPGSFHELENLIFNHHTRRLRYWNKRATKTLLFLPPAPEIGFVPAGAAFSQNLNI